MAVSVVGVGAAAGESAGTTTTASTVSVTPTRHASSASGDRVYVIQGANNTSAAAPADWTTVFKDTIVGSGAASAGAGQRWLSVYWRDYDGVWTMPAFTLTSAAQNTQTIGTITLRKGATDTWNTPTVSSTATYFGTAGTAFTATTTAFATIGHAFAPFASALMACAVTNDNVTMTSGAVTGTNSFTSGTVTERVDGGNATGNDVALKLHTCLPTARGHPAGTLTHTGTLSAASQGGVIFVQQTASPPKIETFTANFDSGFTGWGGNTGATTSEAGAVRLSHPATGGVYENLISNSPYYTVVDSAAFIEVKDYGNTSLTTHLTQFGIAAHDDVDNAKFLAQNGQLYGHYRVPGAGFTQPAGSPIALNTTTHRWLRIRADTTTLYWDTSPDGSAWTNRYSVALPWPPVSVKVEMTTGNDSTEASGSSALFDNFNVAGVAAPTPKTHLYSTAVHRASLY